MAARKISYVASASVGYPHDLMEKVRKAKDMTGTRSIHLLASCPTEWRYETQLILEVARKVVECRVFPLFEVFGGIHWVLNPMSVKTPVDEYPALQGRFKGLTERGRAGFQEWVDMEWGRIENKCEPQHACEPALYG